MNKKWLVAVLGAAAMTVSAGALAQAAVPAFYIGAEIGQADVDLINEKDTGIKLLGGYQFHRNIAAEVAYGMFFDKDGVEITGFEAVALGIFPLTNQFSIFGKLGFARLEAEGPGGTGDDTALTFAIGAQFDVTRNLGIRASWQKYDTDPEIDWLSVGVVWRF